MILDNKYTVSYRIPPSCIDGKCRLSTLACAVIAQDLAAGHYSSTGLSIPHLQKIGLTWVLSKQHFEIHEYPLWLDELIIQTWAQAPKGPFCFRDFAYYYAENGKKNSINEALNEQSLVKNEDTKKLDGKNIGDLSLCMRAASCWISLNTVTGEIIKDPGKKILGSLTFNEDCMDGKVFAKIVLPEKWDVEEHLRPTLLDIDINNHVNNLAYIRWIFSFMEADFCKTRLVRILDTNFISAAKYGEELICRCLHAEKDTCIHSIIRASDGSDVFKAKTIWAPEAELSRPLKLGEY